MNFKLNKQEKKWVLYDVGNSAFTLLTVTIMPIYFNALAQGQGVSSVNYLSYWGYATSISTLIVAFLGPVIGTMSDFRGWRKYLFFWFMLIGAIGCGFLGVSSIWYVFLILFILVKSSYSISLVIYDSMLTDITSEDRMDKVSAAGYGWGYIGSCIPFILGLGVIFLGDKMGLESSLAMALAFLITSIWWIVMSLPLYKSYNQVHYVIREQQVVKNSFVRLAKIFGELKKDKKIFLFLVAFFFYIDGVYTIIDMATAYGTALGLDSTGLLVALLVTQVVAFPAAIYFGRISTKYRTGSLIMVCIVAYFLIAIYGVFMTKQYQFWILAVAVGMFQGAIQSMSRSYFAKIIPANKSGEYFGIYDICGKGASFLGTMLVSVVSQLTGQVNLGVGALTIMFIIGFVVFRKMDRMES